MIIILKFSFLEDDEDIERQVVNKVLDLVVNGADGEIEREEFGNIKIDDEGDDDREGEDEDDNDEIVVFVGVIVLNGNDKFEDCVDCEDCVNSDEDDDELNKE
eukprot:CAMPEP_0174824008 /NCGR_PEP_ID=MMETSP1107-20130205/29721_1 /TAXON_ID=36770 /ORGANISM="Paraphysomonas vestita, Strain GFlagA" /LENGTH=102 /DNA_ID=CAMNT_0016049055 /DNA_START=244 /DNA_END=553 /DNA_ORIENTATION=+